ncbi:MAG: hypothetical protein ACT4P6_22680 [Gemmatimonadaceae bacterium]
MTSSDASRPKIAATTSDHLDEMLSRYLGENLRPSGYWYSFIATVAR